MKSLAVPGTSPLTPEQEAIAAAAPGARLLVTAGAGTGKTHVLIERLQRLADGHGLNLADDVLVVSFSRAAVGEIRKRMRASDGAAAYGTVATFDSFATHLLARYSPGQAWSSMDFDGRIGAALSLIEKSEDARIEIRRLRHVVVDEVQDLVGVRRRLVQAILECSDGGFTLFGDPAQGIYNFQASDPVERQLGSLVFFDWVKNGLSGPVVDEPNLTKNFRYQTTEARSAEWAGPLLNGANPDYRQILERLEDGLYDLEALGSLDELTNELRARVQRETDNDTVGILCRFNFEVLRVSEKLAAAGIPHHYQRPAADRAVPAWVARVLGSCDSAHLGRTAFNARAGEVDLAPTNGWALLKRFDPRGNRDMLDLRKIQERIRVGDIPPELVRLPDAQIIVSTIHRAKGLEFDRVLLFEPDQRLLDGEDDTGIGEEARQLYVARTRARSRYGILSREPREYAKKNGNPGGVWTVSGFARHGPYVKEIEVKGTHSWSQDPAGAFALSGDATAIQQYIEHEVRPLDPLHLRRTVVEMRDGRRMYYVIEHDGHEVGVVDLGWILRAILHPRYDRNWPKDIDGLFVESVDTVAGTSAAGTRAGLSSSGLWLRVRPYGLGRLHWTPND